MLDGKNLTWASHQDSVAEELESLVAIGEPVRIVGRVRERLKEVAAIVKSER